MSGQRINKFDNMKGMAILLIVLGHFLLSNKTEGIAFLVNVLYIVHLPIFFFVSGYFSKIGPDEPVKAFKRLIVPFILFCIVYYLIAKYILLKNTQILFINPGYGLWFLISLFTMKMLLPIIDRFKHPLCVSLILSLLIGFFDCNILGISRTFVFLPSFIIGFYFNDYKEILSENYRNVYRFVQSRYVKYVLLVITVILIAIVAYNISFRCVTCRLVYKDLSEIIFRFAIIVLGMAFTLILNSLMSNKEMVFTKFGRNCLSVYVLHILVAEIISSNLNNIFSGHNKLFFLAALILSFAVVYVLSHDVVTQYLNRILDGISSIFIKA